MKKAGLTFRYAHKAEPYAEALRRAGIEPELLSPDEPRTIAGLDGLMLSGGVDLNPELYGAAPQPNDEEPDDPLDALELNLLDEAMRADLPVLAICRGLQLFNVAHGGTLIQHLDNSETHVVRGNDPARAVHRITVEPGTRLAAILGDGEHMVNSRHHQAAGRIGAGLRISARSVPDGVVEALERDDRRFAVAVQWHPEDQVRKDAEQMKLFEAFAAALG